MDSGWCTIESDPGVFTELIQQIGVTGVLVEEIYSITPESLSELKEEVYGLIFLFKWRPEAATKDVTSTDNNDIMSTNDDIENQIPSTLFFANQRVNNACATQALLSIILNTVSNSNLGEALRDFKAFTADFDPMLRGEMIGDTPLLRTAHNSFARPEPFVSEERRFATEEDDVFHFVAFLPYKGKIYELDGLKPQPTVLEQAVGAGNWLSLVAPHIQRRIDSYNSNAAANEEIRFNLLAVVKDRRPELESEIEALEQAIMAINSVDEDSAGESNQRDELVKDLAMINMKLERWKIENMRRKHNYVPFTIELLKAFAKENILESMIAKAEQTRKEKLEQAVSQAMKGQK